MSKALTLSIVIPVYNEEDHLEACLNSIAAQTVLPDEVIVVDNNCTDLSMDIVRSYPFTRIVKELEPGIVHARNAGFEAVRTELIGRIDADTVLPIDWVEKAKSFMTAQPDALLTGGCYLYDLGFPRFSGWVTENFSFRVNKIILGEYIAWGSNLVLRKSMWDEVKDKVIIDNDIHEDIDLGLHLTRQGYRIVYDKNRLVGIDSRIFSEQRRTREQHFVYLKRWPATLKRHNLRRAWLGTVGAYVVYYLYYPLLITHNIGKLLERKEPQATDN